MDRVLKVLLFTFLLSLVILAGPFIYWGIVERAYSASLNSTLNYSIEISSTTQLENPTFFVPLPTDLRGTSPILVAIGSGNVTGTPTLWNYALYGIDNVSMLKIWADVIPPPVAGTDVIMYIVDATAFADTALDNTQPNLNSYALNPKNNVTELPCSEVTEASGNPRCYKYQSVIYASYRANPDARVTISLTLSGTNTWAIFRDYRNGYSDSLSIEIQGSGKGWYAEEGVLITGVGDTNPFLNRG